MTEFEQELHDLRAFSMSARADEELEEIEAGAELIEDLPFEIPRD
jgi:hypothetical protein